MQRLYGQRNNQMRFLDVMDKDYEQYLRDHSEPKVKCMHFIGQLATLLYIGCGLYIKEYLLLLLAPLVVYPFAVCGHIFFGKKGNRPSFYKMSFLQAKRCDIKMFIDILKCKYKIW